MYTDIVECMRGGIAFDVGEILMAQSLFLGLLIIACYCVFCIIFHRSLCRDMCLCVWDELAILFLLCYKIHRFPVVSLYSVYIGRNYH